MRVAVGLRPSFAISASFDVINKCLDASRELQYQSERLVRRGIVSQTHTT